MSTNNFTLGNANNESILHIFNNIKTLQICDRILTAKKCAKATECRVKDRDLFRRQEPYLENTEGFHPY